MKEIDRKYDLTEVMHNKEFNEFLDALIAVRGVERIVLFDHILERGWENCDLDLNIEFDRRSGRAPDLGGILGKYEKVTHFRSRKKDTGEWETISANSGSEFLYVGGYFLEIMWGYAPNHVPYLVLREQGKKKRKWKWVK